MVGCPLQLEFYLLPIESHLNFWQPGAGREKPLRFSHLHADYVVPIQTSRYESA